MLVQTLNFQVNTVNSEMLRGELCQGGQGLGVVDQATGQFTADVGVVKGNPRETRGAVVSCDPIKLPAHGGV